MKVKATGELSPFRGISDLGNFYVEHRKSLTGYAYRLLQDEARAEDVVQEALIKVILASPELNSKEQALAYIKKTIENLSIDIFRIEGRRPTLVVLDDAVVENEIKLHDSYDHSDFVAAADDAAVIRQALSLLSPAERAALVMWEIEGRSASEIAQSLGIKESSVRHTVSRARASMRRVLSEFIIDEKRGLTALDLLSRTYRRSAEISRRSARSALSLLLLVFAYLGFTNFVDSPSLDHVKVSSSSKVANILPTPNKSSAATSVEEGDEISVSSLKNSGASNVNASFSTTFIANGAATSAAHKCAFLG
ncbi:MAG: RNA polymerase sigma factor, partial [Cyclobacteriaceae bacterium]|nr:RNA polymerase sigma factor [Cyclobacteriaceae bacterium]